MRSPVFLLFVVALSSCSTKKTSNYKPLSGGLKLEIDLSKERAVGFSEIFDTVTYTKLESDGKHFLGDVKKIKRFGKKIFIQCNNGVFIFSSAGKFINTIGKKGKGPGKFQLLADFEVDTVNRQVILLDRRGKKLLYHDYSGLFVNEWITGLAAEAFIKITDVNYLFYTTGLFNKRNENEAEYKLISYNRALGPDMQHKSLAINDHTANFIQYADLTNFNKKEDTLIFIQSMVDTIYNYFPATFSVRPRYVFDFGINKIPGEFLEQDYKDVSYFDRAFEKKSYASFFRAFLFENHSNLITFARKGKVFFLICYNKASKKFIIGPQLVDDFYPSKLSEEIDWNTLPRGSSGDDLLYVLESTDVIGTVDSMRTRTSPEKWQRFKTENSQLFQISQGLTLKDNPIIRTCTVKKK
jgi:6-bladed beta-propeller